LHLTIFAHLRCLIQGKPKRLDAAKKTVKDTPDTF